MADGADDVFGADTYVEGWDDPEATDGAGGGDTVLDYIEASTPLFTSILGLFGGPTNTTAGAAPAPLATDDSSDTTVLIIIVVVIVFATGLLLYFARRKKG